LKTERAANLKKRSRFIANSCDFEQESKAARIALANSKRAAGKIQEALALERDQAQLDSTRQSGARRN